MRQRFYKLHIPPGCHPLVRKLFLEMNEQQIGVLDMAKRAGVDKNSLRDWRTRCNPSLVGLEACFNVLGLTLRAVRNKGLMDYEDME